MPRNRHKIKVINADNSGDESEFIKKINELSLDIMLIIASPSITSGVSLENGRFNGGVFGFFNGVLHGSLASQALARVRGAEEIHVWCAADGLEFSHGLATKLS